MQGVSGTWSELALGDRHTPILSSPPRRGNQGSKVKFRLWPLAFVVTALLWSWGHRGSCPSSGPWKDFHSRTQRPTLKGVAGGGPGAQDRRSPQPREACLEDTHLLPPGERALVPLSSPASEGTWTWGPGQASAALSTHISRGGGQGGTGVLLGADGPGLSVQPLYLLLFPWDPVGGPDLAEESGATWTLSYPAWDRGLISGMEGPGHIPHLSQQSPTDHPLCARGRALHSLASESPQLVKH